MEVKKQTKKPLSFRILRFYVSGHGKKKRNRLVLPALSIRLLCI